MVGETRLMRHHRGVMSQDDTLAGALTSCSGLDTATWAPCLGSASAAPTHRRDGQGLAPCTVSVRGLCPSGTAPGARRHGPSPLPREPPGRPFRPFPGPAPRPIGPRVPWEGHPGGQSGRPSALVLPARQAQAHSRRRLPDGHGAAVGPSARR